MGDWDDDEWEAPNIAKLDDAPESWSDEEGHEAHKVQEPVVVERMPKKPEKPKEKTLLELKIEEREKREKAQNEMAGHQADGPTRELEEFGGGLEEALDSVALGGGPADPLDEAIKMSTAKDPPLREPKLPSANEFVAKTDADFETLSKMMYSQLKPYEGRKGFTVALKSFIRASTDKMSTDECKDLSAFVSVIYNDKIKADREKDNKGKKKKGAPSTDAYTAALPRPRS
ncbi:MAG: hypothetical protein SGPRY_005076 [Prymnesium sp.]